MIFALVSSSWLGKGAPYTECIVLTLQHSHREAVATFFEPSVEAIADAFEKQRQAAARLQIQIKVSLTLTSSYVPDLIVLCSMLF
jgi:hypothetical protein